MSLRSLLGAATFFAISQGAAASDLLVRVLDKTGQPLPDAVVLVDSAMPDSRPPPMLEATVRQEKLKFRPYVTVVNVGAKVVFTNQDAWDHHVILGPVGAGGFYLDPGQNQQLRLAGKVGETVAQDHLTLGKPGVYLLGCHLHGSMRGHVYVANTPWARATGNDGQAQIAALPAGPALVRIWHPDQVVEGPAVSVQVPAGGAAVTINTQVMAARRR